MIQRHIKHKPKRFADCATCGHQPLHIQCRGRTSAEATNLQQPTTADRHLLECPRCRHATTLSHHLRATVIEWNASYAVTAARRAA